jgi:hypothetical protein
MTVLIAMGYFFRNKTVSIFFLIVCTILHLTSCNEKKIGLYNVSRNDEIEELLQSGYSRSDIDDNTYYLETKNKISEVVFDKNGQIVLHSVYVSLESESDNRLKRLTNDSLIEIGGSTFKCIISRNYKLKRNSLILVRRW